MPVGRDDILAATADAERSLAPIGPQQLLDALAPLGALFGWPDNWTAQLPIYEQVFAPLPAWAVAAAVRGACAQCEFFPKPAQLSAQLPSTFHELNRALVKLRLALFCCDKAVARR
ncbi:MAG TPA: hypothetical protein VGR91_19780 [Stellaceae bacterium]|nr:hypothetical protein [Stellaceae bacterium]